MARNASIDRVNAALAAYVKVVTANTASAVLESIREGSAVTGSPGQPVDTGHLKNSWGIEWLERNRVALISTNVEYAAVIEYGIRTGRPFPLRPHTIAHGARKGQQIGGHHSVAKTRAGIQRLVDIASHDAVQDILNSR